MEKNFEMPTLTLVVFENEDVITTSFMFFRGAYGLPGFNPLAE